MKTFSEGKTKRCNTWTAEMYTVQYAE